MRENFKAVDVLRQGDDAGNGMVLRLVTGGELVIYSIAVPQDGNSHTGPTWCYIFEDEGVTLIDPGCSGTFGTLLEGLRFTPYSLRDIDRVVITHGHQDHDGGVPHLAEITGAEFWAHEIYPHLLPHDPRDIMLAPSSPIKEELARTASSHGIGPTVSAVRDSYIQRRRGQRVDHPIRAGETLGRLAFLDAPGHSPDEICVTLDGLVFTGDHVLPEISPHPTMKTRYGPEVKRGLPPRYHDEDGSYGLATYLRSLKAVADLGPDTGVMPAHRLYNKGRFNFQAVARAAEVIQHHGHRLGLVLGNVGDSPATLEEVTRRTFEKRKLEGLNLFAALTEAVAHLEVLEDMGDVELTPERRLRRTGSDNYRQLIRDLVE